MTPIPKFTTVLSLKTQIWPPEKKVINMETNRTTRMSKKNKMSKNIKISTRKLKETTKLKIMRTDKTRPTKIKKQKNTQPEIPMKTRTSIWIKTLSLKGNIESDNLSTKNNNNSNIHPAIIIIKDNTLSLSKTIQLINNRIPTTTNNPILATNHTNLLDHMHQNTKSSITLRNIKRITSIMKPLDKPIKMGTNRESTMEANWREAHNSLDPTITMDISCRSTEMFTILNPKLMSTEITEIWRRHTNQATEMDIKEPHLILQEMSKNLLTDQELKPQNVKILIPLSVSMKPITEKFLAMEEAVLPTLIFIRESLNWTRINVNQPVNSMNNVTVSDIRLPTESALYILTISMDTLMPDYITRNLNMVDWKIIATIQFCITKLFIQLDIVKIIEESEE